MEMNIDNSSNQNVITAYNEDQIFINNVPHRTPFILTPLTIKKWDISDIDAITSESIKELISLAPEVIIFATGAETQQPSPEVIKLLISANIGYETMNTNSAIRTYAVLASENRKIVVCFLM